MLRAACIVSSPLAPLVAKKETKQRLLQIARLRFLRWWREDETKHAKNQPPPHAYDYRKNTLIASSEEVASFFIGIFLQVISKRIVLRV